MTEVCTVNYIDHVGVAVNDIEAALAFFKKAFDVPDAMSSRGVREKTTVATQALLLMNNEFVRKQAEHFALRLGDKDPRVAVEEAYWLALSRKPTEEEIKLSLELINSEGQSLANFCHILFTLNEFIYVD